MKSGHVSSNNQKPSGRFSTFFHCVTTAALTFQHRRSQFACYQMIHSSHTYILRGTLIIASLNTWEDGEKKNIAIFIVVLLLWNGNWMRNRYPTDYYNLNLPNPFNYCFISTSLTQFFILFVLHWFFSLFSLFLQEVGRSTLKAGRKMSFNHSESTEMRMWKSAILLFVFVGLGEWMNEWDMTSAFFIIH